ncbi:MAG: glycoside hydrolase family 92 protein [Bacteroidaceae bacterium]|nr:glycoside hydrolase family 92 protein [Bacteroidaceae bacterium]
MIKKLSFALLLCCIVSTRTSAQDVLDNVNLYIGTANDYGQMTPGACMPYSQIQVCPDSKPRQHPGYDYEVTQISGFSVNRLSGVGGSGCGGNVSLMPDDTGADVRLIKSTEQAAPGYYSVQLSNGVWFTATANRRMAVERFSYPSAEKAVLLLDPGTAFDKVYKSSFNKIGDNVGQGYIDCANTCRRGNYHLHYRLYTSSPFEMQELEDGKKKLTFPNLSARYVEVRIVISTGLAQELDAMKDADVWRTDFLSMVNQAQHQWRQLLSTMKVEGGTTDQRTIFYTSLYRTFHSPFMVTDRNMKRYLGTDGKEYEAKDFTYYSSWSLWDTYRTKFPLITLLDPQRSSDIMQSLSTLYITGKKDWSTQYECVPTVRTEHAIATLLDAYRQGISIPNLRAAYAGMTAEVKRLSLKSPDQCLEAAGDFWALGQLADELGMQEDARKWTARGEEIFDSIWPREFQKIDDSFLKMRGNGLYQGTRWQYRWGAPMFLDRMISMVGKKELAQELVTFFEKELYNQGNEPDIHVPFLFSRLGMPEKTGLTVRPLATEVVTHRYGGNDAYPTPWVGCAFTNAPRGYAPEMDEDDGAMSAWYVFASIGLYPLVVGEAQYEVFSPLFDKVTMRLADKDVTITTKGRIDKSQPLKRVTWNGKVLKNWRISVTELKKGGELVFMY